MPSHPFRFPAILLLLLSLLLAGCASPATPVPGVTAQVVATAQPVINAPALAQDLIILSMEENGFAHLFVTIPGKLELTRITAGPWNDITPSLSPDGSRLAFASNREAFMTCTCWTFRPAASNSLRTPRIMMPRPPGRQTWPGWRMRPLIRPISMSPCSPSPTPPRAMYCLMTTRPPTTPLPGRPTAARSSSSPTGPATARCGSPTWIAPIPAA